MATWNHDSGHVEHLASHGRCSDRIGSTWQDFLSKRIQRLEQQTRLGEASEKVAENILEDLFTTVLDCLSRTSITKWSMRTSS